MDAILIPAAALDSPEYKHLQNTEKLFLIALYEIHGREPSFSIDLNSQRRYRMTRCAPIGNRITALVKAGFLIVEEDRKQITICNFIRVFRFRYPVVEMRAA